MSDRPALPSLEAVDALPAAAVPGFLAQLAALQLRVACRLGGAQPVSTSADRLLSIEEAAARAGMSTHWLYRHAKTLPFIRRPSARAVRVSEAALARWLAARPR